MYMKIFTNIGGGGALFQNIWTKLLEILCTYFYNHVSKQLFGNSHLLLWKICINKFHWGIDRNSSMFINRYVILITILPIFLNS